METNPVKEPPALLTPKKAAAIAADHGERLAVEARFAGLGYSWKDVLDLLEGVGMPETLGFRQTLLILSIPYGI